MGHLEVLMPFPSNVEMTQLLHCQVLKHVISQGMKVNKQQA
jgi:hypothetical protein